MPCTSGYRHAPSFPAESAYRPPRLPVTQSPRDPLISAETTDSPAATALPYLRYRWPDHRRDVADDAGGNGIATDRGHGRYQRRRIHIDYTSESLLLNATTSRRFRQPAVASPHVVSSATSRRQRANQFWASDHIVVAAATASPRPLSKASGCTSPDRVGRFRYSISVLAHHCVWLYFCESASGQERGPSGPAAAFDGMRTLGHCQQLSRFSPKPGRISPSKSSTTSSLPPWPHVAIFTPVVNYAVNATKSWSKTDAHPLTSRSRPHAL